MGRIRTYDSQISAAGPVGGRNATPEDYGSSVYRGLEEAGQGASYLGEILARRAEASQKSDAHAGLSELGATAEQRLRDDLANGDPKVTKEEFAQRFIDQYDEEAKGIEDKVSTAAAKDFYTRANGVQRARLLKLAMTGQSELTREANRENYKTTQNNATNSLIFDPSHENFQTQTQLNDEYLSTLDLPEKEKEKLRYERDRNFAKAQVMGMINQGEEGPTRAREFLSSGQNADFIDGNTRIALMHQADMKDRANEANVERRKRLEKDALKEQQRGTENEFLSKLYNEDTGEKNALSPDDVLKSNLDPDRKEHYINLIAKSAKEDITDNSKFNDLYQDIKAGRITDEEDLDQWVGNGLTYTGVKNLREEISGRRTEAGKIEAADKKGLDNIAIGMLDPKSSKVMGVRDVEGGKRLERWRTWFRQEYKERRKTHSAAELLTQPTADRPNPLWMGHDLERFRPTNDEKMDSMMNSYNEGAGIGPRQPEPVFEPKKKRVVNPDGTKESIDDFLKR